MINEVKDNETSERVKKMAHNTIEAMGRSPKTLQQTSEENQMTNAFYSANDFKLASPINQPINAASARIFDPTLQKVLDSTKSE